jgi:hypothetical protein
LSTTFSPNRFSILLNAIMCFFKRPAGLLS